MDLSIASDEQQDESSKLCKIEVLSAQETVNKFIQTDKWKEVESIPENSIPQYKLVVYQEKTLLFGQNPNENREYEIINDLQQLLQ